MWSVLVSPLSASAKKKHKEKCSDENAEGAHSGHDYFCYHLHVVSQGIWNTGAPKHKLLTQAGWHSVMLAKQFSVTQKNSVLMVFFSLFFFFSIMQLSCILKPEHLKGWSLFFRYTLDIYFRECVKSDSLPWISLRILAAVLLCSSNKKKRRELCLGWNPGIWTLLRRKSIQLAQILL